MQNDSSKNEPRTIWQNQPTEPSTMTSEEIREKIKRMRAKTRQGLLGGAAGALVVIGIGAFGIERSDSAAMRTLCAFLIAENDQYLHVFTAVLVLATAPTSWWERGYGKRDVPHSQ